MRIDDSKRPSPTSPVKPSGPMPNTARKRLLELIAAEQPPQESEQADQPSPLGQNLDLRV